MNTLTRSGQVSIAALRVVIGWVFLYAGLEKIFGAEPFSAAGFLQFGTAGTAPGAVEGAIINPTRAFWVDLASNLGAMGVIDVLVPFGQVAIGAALILGLGTRFAGAMGFLMMSFITIAAWDFAFGIVNYTAVLAVAALLLGIMRAGEMYGVDAIIDQQSVVKRTPALRYVLG